MRKIKQVTASFTVHYTDGTLKGVDASIVVPTNWDDFRSRIDTFDILQHELKLVLDALELIDDEVDDFSSEKKT